MKQDHDSLLERRERNYRIGQALAGVLILAMFLGLSWIGYNIGREHERADKVTPYDHAYAEQETYIAGYQPGTHTETRGKQTIITHTMDPIYMTRTTGRILHETRYNHTEPFPHTAGQGLCTGAAISLLCVLVGIGLAVMTGER